MEKGKMEIFTESGVEVLEAPAESIWALKVAIHYARNEKRPKTVFVGVSTNEHEVVTYSIPPTALLKFTESCCIDLKKAEALYETLRVRSDGQFLLMKDGSFAGGGHQESVLSWLAKGMHDA